MIASSRMLQVLSAAILVFSPVFASESQTRGAAAPPASTLPYADLADLALNAPVAAHVRIARAVPLKSQDSPGLAVGHRRFFVEADVIALIRGPAELPTRVSYLVDLPDQPNGRAARLERRSERLVLASAVAGRVGELRLVAPDAQLPYDGGTAERLRGILREAVQSEAPPRIAGVGRAFHVPGALPGESETQIFLQTANARPISLTVLRRPGEQPRWAVALGEIVDDAAAPPQRDTLLWYRLACGLPTSLPRESLREASPSEAQAIARDYQVVLAGLGPCQRTRARR